MTGRFHSHVWQLRIRRDYLGFGGPPYRSRGPSPTTGTPALVSSGTSAPPQPCRCPRGPSLHSGCWVTCWEPSSCWLSCFSPRAPRTGQPLLDPIPWAPGPLGCGTCYFQPVGCGPNAALSLGGRLGFSCPTCFCAGSWESACHQPACGPGSHRPYD